MPTDNILQIRLNGDSCPVPSGVSIADMLRELGINPAKVAVERNREIIPRSALCTVSVMNGDEFEIVHFVGGG